MKGKRYTTEDKIHVLREGDRDKSILEGCRQHNISEAGFHRWKRQFSQMDDKPVRVVGPLVATPASNRSHEFPLAARAKDFHPHSEPLQKAFSSPARWIRGLWWLTSPAALPARVRLPSAAA